MRRDHSAIQARAIGAAILLALAFLASPASPSEVLGTNVRPFFAVGPSVPFALEDGRAGFGLSLGFEAEQSALLSVLFRFEWQQLHRRFYSPYYPSYSQDFAVVNWSVGARVHLRRNATWRPYGEACLGVRLGDGTNDGSIALPLFAPTYGGGPLAEGLAGTLRIGISSAGHGRAGFFLDSGVDLLLEEPDRYGIVPVRMGVVFP